MITMWSGNTKLKSQMYPKTVANFFFVYKKSIVFSHFINFIYFLRQYFDTR